MAILSMHLLGSPVLRQPSAPVTEVNEEIRRFVADLFETMDAENGVGLAANQVGVARRVAVVDADGDRFAMINPVILERSGQVTAEEGCLSIPEIYGEVTRAAHVVIEAWDEHGRTYRKEAVGLAARAIQHEIDHLDGVLFIDHLGALKREMILRRWRKEHKGESYVKPPKQPALAADEEAPARTG
ncbi:MAG: peptide deformylase [Gemmatimonadota bacterium]